MCALDVLTCWRFPSPWCPSDRLPQPSGRYQCPRTHGWVCTRPAAPSASQETRRWWGQPATGGQSDKTFRTVQKKERRKKQRKNTLLVPCGKLNLHKGRFANVSPLVQRHLGRIYRYGSCVLSEVNLFHTCSEKRTMVQSPTQLCRLYRLLIGFSRRLWESKTAFSPTPLKTRAKTWSVACSNLMYTFLSLRKTRYTRMATTHDKLICKLSHRVTASCKVCHLLFLFFSICILFCTSKLIIMSLLWSYPPSP